MKVGDLVELIPYPNEHPNETKYREELGTGTIVRCVKLRDGTYSYLVSFPSDELCSVHGGTHPLHQNKIRKVSNV